jgi:hypothetical protein
MVECPDADEIGDFAEASRDLDALGVSISFQS